MLIVSEDTNVISWNSLRRPSSFHINSHSVDPPETSRSKPKHVSTPFNKLIKKISTEKCPRKMSTKRKSNSSYDVIHEISQANKN